MKARIGKEIGLLSLPILALGAFGWVVTQRQAFVAPPEDLSLGRPRLVIGKWREEEPTPFDVYRGYIKRYEFESWIGGSFPPLKGSGRPRTVRVYRNIYNNYPLPQLSYRFAGKWHAVPSTFEDPEVRIVPLVGAEELRDRMTNTLLVRTSALPHQPKEVQLRGSMGACVDYREDVMIGSVRSGEIIKSWNVHSKPIAHPLSLSSPQPVISHQSLLTLNTIGLDFLVEDNPPRPTSQVDIFVQANIEWDRPWTDRRKGVSQSSYKSCLFDANGKKVATSRSWGWGASDRSHFRFDVNFSTTYREWKSWKRPLTLQSALSVDDCWPLEVNVVFPVENSSGPPTPSKIPFCRR